jgi:hypothetical protein
MSAQILLAEPDPPSVEQVFAEPNSDFLEPLKRDVSRDLADAGYSAAKYALFAVRQSRQG